ncbi:hypothetical protein EAH87_05220 [Sphingomonas koreensis]|nr:hypothetical protein EAH87_05220 [Sphingomonas koreensis]
MMSDQRAAALEMEEQMTDVHILAIDLAKRSFQVCATAAGGGGVCGCPQFCKVWISAEAGPLPFDVQGPENLENYDFLGDLDRRRSSPPSPSSISFYNCLDEHWRGLDPTLIHTTNAHDEQQLTTSDNDTNLLTRPKAALPHDLPTVVDQTDRRARIQLFLGRFAAVDMASFTVGMTAPRTITARPQWKVIRSRDSYRRFGHNLPKIKKDDRRSEERTPGGR